MSIDLFGKINGIPVWIDPMMEPDRILVMRNTDSNKPDISIKVSNPRIKGLVASGIKALIISSNVADNLDLAQLQIQKILR